MRYYDKFDLEALREAGRRAKLEMDTWPKWKKDLVILVSDAAASEESIEALRKIRSK